MVAIFRKKVSSYEVLHSPVRAYCRGIGKAHIFYCEMFIIGRNLTIFSCVALIFQAEDDIVFKFHKSAFEVREIRRHPIIEFFR